MSKNKSECVKVVVRCRPLDQKETTAGHKRCVEMDTKRGVVTVNSSKASKGDSPNKTFTYDAIYDWNSAQRDLYDEVFRDLVDSVMSGFNGTIFAYGQTGTGKTFTMQGPKDNPGVIPTSFDHIFTHISRSENQQYLVRASYLEIYLDEIRDLLSKDQSSRLELKERPDTGVYVKDLSSFVTKSVKEIEHVMGVGNQNRSVGSTNMNEHSSRSHAIFVVTVECSEIGVDGENHIRVGRLNLVDLAGSERQSKTGSEGSRFKEATKINLSLSALGNVISALVDGKSSHIPYRDSKLTRLLQDSLGGNAKTVMVANIGPADYNYDETLSTLRYANRAKDIKNKPMINEDPKDALLREFQEEIERLKKTLASKGGPKTKRRVKKERRNANGELIEDDESDEEGEVNDEEAYERTQRAELEEQKQSILNNQNLIAEERQRYLQDLKDREEKLIKEKQNKDALSSKIKAMESKLLMGGRNIVDHTNEQQRALEQRRREIIDQKNKERDMQQTLENKEENTLEMHDHFTSLQQEVDVKTKKLKKLFAKLQNTRQEILDLQEEHSRERQELEQTQMELTRELKLKMLIIDNFIPVEEKSKVTNRGIYDEDQGTWHLKPLTKIDGQVMATRPVSALNNKRPTSQYAAISGKEGNPRFRGENILLVELDMPNRTTRDYEGPAVAPRVQAALDAAMKDEDDIDIEATSLKVKLKSKKKDGSLTKPKGNKPVSMGTSQFPSSRGLVPRSK